jgi:uncharacterized membrane protein
VSERGEREGSKHAAEADADAGADPEAGPVAEPDADAGPVAEPDAGPVAEPDAGARPVAGSDAGAVSGGRAPSGIHRLVARLRALSLIPQSPAPPPWRKLLPEGPLGWISAILLWAVFLYYVRTWMKGNDELLFDTLFANDDSRTAHFPFHMWGPEKALADDPIALEMKGYTMPGVLFLYRILVPVVGIYAAPKVVQALALALLAWAGLLLARSRRAGLACGVLLVFLMLRHNFIVNRIAGGFGRAFVFPCFALWLAGAITGSERARYAATLIGAVTQNYTVAILLGAEGIYSVLDAVGRSWALFFARLKRYALLIAACFALVGAYTYSQAGKGSVHTIEQVESSVAFRSRHRQEYPLADPAPQFARWIVSPFAHAGEKFAGVVKLKKDFEKHGTTWPLFIVAGLMLIGFARLAPRARPAVAFFAATAVTYTAARLFAFKLYAPERYYTFGAPMVGIALAVVSIGLVAPRLGQHRAAIRNALAAAFLVGLCALAGDGIVKKNGMTIEERPGTKLYTFVRKLPPDARIACHPWDGDDIPWWAGRATTGGFETTQMWYVEAVPRTEERTNAVLKALYATSKQEVLDYAKKYRVSHFMIRSERYASDFKKKAEFIEPFTGFIQKSLSSVDSKDLVFADPPESAVVYRDRTLSILEVAKLEEAWRAHPAP